LYSVPGMGPKVDGGGGGSRALVEEQAGSNLSIPAVEKTAKNSKWLSGPADGASDKKTRFFCAQATADISKY
jgi:hypothetical protein